MDTGDDPFAHFGELIGVELLGSIDLNEWHSIFLAHWLAQWVTIQRAPTALRLRRRSRPVRLRMHDVLAASTKLSPAFLVSQKHLGYRSLTVVSGWRLCVAFARPCGLLAYHIGRWPRRLRISVKLELGVTPNIHPECRHKTRHTDSAHLHANYHASGCISAAISRQAMRSPQYEQVICGCASWPHVL